MKFSIRQENKPYSLFGWKMFNNHFDKYIKFLIFLTITQAVTATSVQMRVVKDTASYGYFGHNVGETENNQHISNVLPANFSGPQLLKKLFGKCYNLTQDKYRYIFCPFKNFSQYELSSRWNAYHGILGIWSHWNIKNNTFLSKVYNRGDPCGNIERSVQVFLKCGLSNNLINVTEPGKCTYSAIFETKYVCHNDSLLVYPRLPLELREKWDELLTSFHNKDITQKGYYSSLEKIFQTAGFMKIPVQETSTNAITESSLVGSLFTDLTTCNKEYKALTQEISRLSQELDSLRILLDLNKLGKRTTEPYQ